MEIAQGVITLPRQTQPICQIPRLGKTVVDRLGIIDPEGRIERTRPCVVRTSHLCNPIYLEPRIHLRSVRLSQRSASQKIRVGCNVIREAVHALCILHKLSLGPIFEAGVLKFRQRSISSDRKCVGLGIDIPSFNCITCSRSLAKGSHKQS